MKKLAASITHMPKFSSDMTPQAFIRRELTAHAARMAREKRAGDGVRAANHRKHLHNWLAHVRETKMLSFIKAPDVSMVEIKS